MSKGLIIGALPSRLTDFAQEFASEGSVLVGNSIGSLTVLAAAAKAGSELFKYGSDLCVAVCYLCLFLKGNVCPV